MPDLADPQLWIGLATLTVLEIVLGVDNIIFISILAGRLPAEQRARGRQVGLAVAFATRVGLLLGIGWLATLTQPLFAMAGHPVSGRDLVLLVGGVFLIFKATKEIHAKLEGEAHAEAAGGTVSFTAVVLQIGIVDLVFSLDSVITAVGMVSEVAIMIAANILALGVTLVASGVIADFVERHPTVKMLALSFLIMIGANLVAEGLGQHIPKGYTYFAMAFSVAVELLNLRVRARTPPVVLHGAPAPAPPAEG